MQQRITYEMFSERMRTNGLFGDIVRLEAAYPPMVGESLSYVTLLTDDRNMLLEVHVEYSQDGGGVPRLNILPRSFFSEFHAPKFQKGGPKVP